MNVDICKQHYCFCIQRFNKNFVASLSNAQARTDAQRPRPRCHCFAWL